MYAMVHWEVFFVVIECVEIFIVLVSVIGGGDIWLGGCHIVTVVAFDETNMVKAVDFLGLSFVAPVFFCVWCITNEDTFDGTRKNLQVVLVEDKYKGTTSDLVHM